MPRSPRRSPLEWHDCLQYSMEPLHRTPPSERSNTVSCARLPPTRLHAGAHDRVSSTAYHNTSSDAHRRGHHGSPAQIARSAPLVASTQNQALNALLFLYTKVLKQPLDGLIQSVRAKQPEHLPTVLSRDEV